MLHLAKKRNIVDAAAAAVAVAAAGLESRLAFFWLASGQIPESSAVPRPARSGKAACSLATLEKNI